MTALLTDNLQLMAGAPNGIKKLRELIMELAVRGKLVPQDPSDEPASELLKRIAEEKARLVDERKIKKQKPLAEIGEEEKPFELPATWRWGRLGSQVTESGAGWSPSCDPRPREANEWGVLKVSAVSWGVYQPEENKALPASLEARPEHEVAEGDFLVSRANTAELVARSVVVETTPAHLMLSDKIVRLKLTSLCERRYVNLANSAPFARDYYSRVAGGTSSSMKNVSREQILNLPLALPPLAEQRRIVAKVDDLMLLCDLLEAQQADARSAHAQLVQALLDSLTQARDAIDFATNWQRLAEHFHTLFTTESSIEKLKQTLLQLAVMGKLVPQAPTDEPANELLKRIQAEKNRLIAQGKLKKQKPLAENLEADPPFEIPDTWQWARLEEISYVFSGNAFKSEDFQEATGVRVIKITNAGVGEFIKTDDYLPAGYERKYTSFRVFENDLILALTRPYISTGLKISRCPSEYDGALLNQRVASIRFSSDINNEFGFLFFKSPIVLAIYNARFGNSGLQPNLKMSDVTSLLIPIPPTEEQHRIVTKTNQLTALCDLIKINIKKAHHLNEALSSALIAEGLA